MYYKRNNKRLSVSGRGDYMSTSEVLYPCTKDGARYVLQKK